MTMQNISIQKGRSRPAYKARQIKCKNCGAALAVKDERTRLMTCEYCGTRLELTSAELRVIGKQVADKPEFSLEIGDSYRTKGARFEVIGRLAFIEDGDRSEMTMEYLLYHPCMGSRWLGEYKGEFTISRATHVMPKTVPPHISKGDRIHTWDGRQWIFEESGVYELVYVDGALPWLARAGDRIHYLEFSEKSGSGQIYEIQKIKDETEFGTGKRLDIKSVRAATGKPGLHKKHGIEKLKESFRGTKDSAVIRKRYMQTMLTISIFMAVNLLFLLYCLLAGDTVLRQRIKAADLTKGVYTKTFQLSDNGKATEIKITAMLNNAWMSLETMLIRDNDLLVHEYEPNIEYYSGVEGGESWSEGSQTNSFLMIVPDAGTYKLFIQGVSARGNAASAQKALHDIEVEVTDGAQPWEPFFTASIICVVMLFVTVILYANWKEKQ